MLLCVSHASPCLSKFINPLGFFGCFFSWNHFVLCSRTEAIDGYLSVSCIWKGGMEERGHKNPKKNTENPRVFLGCLIHFWCKHLARTLVKSKEKVTEVWGISSVVDTWHLQEMQGKKWHYSHSDWFDRIKNECLHNTSKRHSHLSSSSSHWARISSCPHQVTEGKTVYPAPQRHKCSSSRGTCV